MRSIRECAGIHRPKSTSSPSLVEAKATNRRLHFLFTRMTAREHCQQQTMLQHLARALELLWSLSGNCWPGPGRLRGSSLSNRSQLESKCSWSCRRNLSLGFAVHLLASACDDRTVIQGICSELRCNVFERGTCGHSEPGNEALERQFLKSIHKSTFVKRYVSCCFLLNLHNVFLKSAFLQVGRVIA
jgi:hypothetical protein